MSKISLALLTQIRNHKTILFLVFLTILPVKSVILCRVVCAERLACNDITNVSLPSVLRKGFVSQISNVHVSKQCLYISCVMRCGVEWILFSLIRHKDIYL